MATTVDGTGDKEKQEKAKQQATTKTYFKKLNVDDIKLTNQDIDLFAGAIENNDQERDLQQVSSFETIDDDDIDIDFCAGFEFNCEECEEFVDECAVCGEYPDDGYNYTECNATEPYLIGNGECNFEYFFGCNFDGGDCDFMDYSLYLWDELKELEMSPVIMLLGFVILLGFCGFAITTVPLVFVALIPALLPLCVLIPIIAVLFGVVFVLTWVLTLPATVLMITGSFIWALVTFPCAMALALVIALSIFCEDQDLQTVKDLLNQTMNMKDLMIQNKTIFF